MNNITMKQKLLSLTVLIVSLLVFSGVVYAVTVPSDRETSFIELGSLKEHQASLSAAANENRALIKELEAENIDLGKKWNDTAKSIQSLEAELFQ